MILGDIEIIINVGKNGLRANGDIFNAYIDNEDDLKKALFNIKTIVTSCFILDESIQKHKPKL